MDARVHPAVRPVGLLLVLAHMAAAQASAAQPASITTRNFVVQAATADLAKQIASEAERFRRELAIEWLGRELPPWHQRCPIYARVHPRLGAGGVTSFRFHGRVPYDWHMEIQGPHDRVLDSVLPHEVMHTVFATHFGQPLPRWADEGACTTVEHASEKAKQDQLLIHFLTNQKGIPFRHMFAMRQYPPEMLPLYAQGYSLTRYLIQMGGRRKFVRFVQDGLASNDWVAAIQSHYGFENLGTLQLTWLDWVKQGSPPLSPTDTPRFQLASHESAGAAGRSTSSPSPLTAKQAAASGTKTLPPGYDSWYAAMRDGAVSAPR